MENIKLEGSFNMENLQPVTEEDDEWEEWFNGKSLTQITDKDEIIYPICRPDSTKTGESYIIGFVIKPYKYDAIRTALYFFIGEDGIPIKRVCSRICWKKCSLGGTMCRYSKDNITRNIGIFYEKIPDDISPEEIEKERENYLDTLASIQIIKETENN